MKDKDNLLEEVARTIERSNMRIGDISSGDGLCSFAHEKVPKIILHEYQHQLDDCIYWKIWDDGANFHILAPGPNSDLETDFELLKRGDLFVRDIAYAPTNGTFSHGHVIVSGTNPGT